MDEHTDAKLSELKLDKELNLWKGKYPFQYGYSYSLIDIIINNPSNNPNVRELFDEADEILSKINEIDLKCRNLAVQKELLNARGWQQKDPKNIIQGTITEERFRDFMKLYSVELSPGISKNYSRAAHTFWYHDSYLFWGHDFEIFVSRDLEPTSISIAG